MITDKHLKELGFVFVGRRCAYLNLKDCRAILMGGILSFTQKPGHEPARCYDVSRLKLESIRRSIRIYNIDYTPPPVMIAEDGSWSLIIKMVPAPLNIDRGYYQHSSILIQTNTK